MNAAERENVCRTIRDGQPCENFRNPGCARIKCCTPKDDDDDAPDWDAGKWRLMLHDDSGRWCVLGLWGDAPDYKPPSPVDGTNIIKVGEGQLATVKL